MIDEHITIRPATDADVGAIVAFGAAVVPEHYGPIIGATAAAQMVEQWWTPESMTTALREGTVFVASAAGVVVGMTELAEWEGDPVIWKLYVRADVRSQGIGRRLLRAAIGAVPESATRIVLEHVAGNERAASFYEREGFAHLRTDPAPSGDPGAATVWRVLTLDPT